MVASRKRLLDLTAADLMSSDLLLVPRCMSLPTAARMLSRHGVTGAPVVNDDGVCIGVISAMDFVRWAEGPKAFDRGNNQVEPFCSSWQMPASHSEKGPTKVEDLMSPDPVVVSGDCPIARLARLMLDEHIHRVVVVDEAKRPEGIVTSLDILAAVARAAETSERETI